MDELTSEQISEWEAYNRLDPIGSWRDDYRISYLCSLITNVAIKSNGKPGAVLTSPLDFEIKWDPEAAAEEVKKQSVEEMKRALIGIASAQNKKHRMTKRAPPRRLANKKGDRK